MDLKKIPFTRKDYWIRVGVSFLIATIANLMIGLVAGYEIARFVYLIEFAYWILIEIRRFHDANKSGMHALLNLIPGLGTLVALILAGVLKSDYDNNQWLSQ